MSFSFGSNFRMRVFGSSHGKSIGVAIRGVPAGVKISKEDVQRELEKRGLKSLMVIQVHDELVFDVPDEEVEELEKLVRREMEGAGQLRVPLRVDITAGESWFKN